MPTDLTPGKRWGLRRLAERRADEFVDPAEIRLRRFGARHDQGQRLRFVFRMQQDTEQVEYLLGRADAAGEHHDSVTHADERLQAFLHVRHDDERVDDRVWCFRGDDARLGNADISSVADALLCMADRCPFHRPFHSAGPATGTDVQPAQSQFVTDQLRIVIFLAADRMPAPADDDIDVRGGQ